MGITEYTQMAPDSLRHMVRERGVKVKGTGKNGALRKIDFATALHKADKKAERDAAKLAETGVKHAGIEPLEPNPSFETLAGNPSFEKSLLGWQTMARDTIEREWPQASAAERIATALERLVLLNDDHALLRELDSVREDNEGLKQQLASAQAENRRLRTQVTEDTRDLP